MGTIWAINKAFFFEVGGFDDGMDFWGGENIDLPLRVSISAFFAIEFTLILHGAATKSVE